MHKLARLAAGRPAETVSSSSNGNGNGNGSSSGPELVMDDFRHTSDKAYGAVDVPDSVIDILAELRCYLQDKCEPPIYVSDRRFMKAVQMLQVRESRGVVVRTGSTALPLQQKPIKSHCCTCKVCQNLSCLLSVFEAVTVNPPTCLGFLFVQVAAYADGRESVNEYDCLLLEHVFGNRPDDSHKVRAQVQDIIASDPGLQQTELVFLGLFGR